MTPLPGSPSPAGAPAATSSVAVTTAATPAVATPSGQDDEDEPRLPSDAELEALARERLPERLRDARYRRPQWQRVVRWVFQWGWLGFLAYVGGAVTTVGEAFANGQPITGALVIQAFLLGRVVPLIHQAPLLALLLPALALALVILAGWWAHRDRARERVVLQHQSEWVRDEKQREHARVVARREGWRRQRAQRKEEEQRAQVELASAYGLVPVKTLDPHDFLFRYVGAVYQPRRVEETGADAEQEARAVLRAARERAGQPSAPDGSAPVSASAPDASAPDASAPDASAPTGTPDASEPEASAPDASAPDASAPLGILVVGRPTLGKTRFAWEAMRDTLSDAVFVNWPSEERVAPFNYASQQGALVALWLDDLQTYANDRQAPTLNALPRRFARSRLVVVATCRDGADEERARERLGGLTQRLTTIRLADITPEESEALVDRLEQRGETVYRDEQDGTAGAPLLGVRAMREQRYPRLPAEAKAALQAMKLLRSVGVYVYPAVRVCLVAQAVCGQLGQGLPSGRRAWRTAEDALTQEGFVRVGAADDEGRHALQPEDAYLEHAVGDYPLAGARLLDDWPTLQAALTEGRDADALYSVGEAFLFTQEGLDATHRADLRSAGQRAAECFRATLALYPAATRDWAWAQSSLGNALRDQARVASGEEQARLLRAAVEAIQQGLSAATPGTSDWGRMQNNLGNALHTQALVASGDEQARLLRAAVEAIQQGLSVATPGTPDWAAQQNNLGVALRAQAGVASGEEQAGLLRAAVEAIQQALTVYTREYSPTSWADAQFNLSIALYVQARVDEEQEDTAAACAHLQQARQCARNAQSVYALGGSTSFELTVQWLAIIAEEMHALNCPDDDDEDQG